MINTSAEVLSNIGRFEYDSYDNQILVYAEKGRSDEKDVQDYPYCYLINLETKPYAQIVLNIGFEVFENEKRVLENMYNIFKDRLKTNNKKKIVLAMNDYLNLTKQLL